MLIEKYKNLVYSVGIKFNLSPDDASDVFQAVWVDLHAELGRLRDVGALRSWLVTVASHKALQQKKSLARGTDNVDALQYEVADDRALVSALHEEAEREQTLHEAIANLPHRCQIIVKLLFYRQPPIAYGDLARELGLAEGSIGFIRRRCLEKLRQGLDERGFS